MNGLGVGLGNEMRLERQKGARLHETLRAMVRSLDFILTASLL